MRAPCANLDRLQCSGRRAARILILLDSSAYLERKTAGSV